MKKLTFHVEDVVSTFIETTQALSSHSRNVFSFAVRSFVHQEFIIMLNEYKCIPLEICIDDEVHFYVIDLSWCVCVSLSLSISFVGEALKLNNLMAWNIELKT